MRDLSKRNSPKKLQLLPEPPQAPTTKMVDKRSLRSNKPESEPSTNGDHSTTSSSKTNANSKSAPIKAASTRTNSVTAKGPTDDDTADDNTTPQTNGVHPVENGVNGATEDVEMGDEASDAVDKKKSIPGKKDKDGDDEMTVVVPPPNSSKLVGRSGEDEHGDVMMEGAEKTAGVVEEARAEETVDPVVKAVAGMLLLIRERLDPELIASSSVHDVRP